MTTIAKQTKLSPESYKDLLRLIEKYPHLSASSTTLVQDLVLLLSSREMRSRIQSFSKVFFDFN